MKTESVVNTQSMSEEAVICIVVKDDRHQNIMSVALQMGVQELRTIERDREIVAKFIDLLGYRGITLQSDTVKGDKESNGLIENAVSSYVESSQPSNVTLKAARKNHSVTNHRFGRGWWDVQDAYCPDVQEIVTGKRSSKDCTARTRHKNLSLFGEKVLATQISTDPMNRMNSSCKFGIWLGMRSNSAEMSHWKCRWCSQSS